MSRIMQAWEELLREAISSDFDDQQFALFQIGLILQRHNPNIPKESDVYEETLSRELMRLSLDESRQQDTVTYLVTLLETQPQAAASLLYTLSQAQAHLATEPLRDAILARYKKFDNEAIYQALMALDTVRKNDDDAAELLAKSTRLQGLLTKWSEHDDDLIAGKAESLLGKLN